MKIKKLRIAIICVAAVAIVLGTFVIYAADYYSADKEALAVLEGENIVVYKDYTIFKADNAESGFIFIPVAR